MIRAIIRAERKQIRLDIPKEYIGKDIEVTYVPVEEVNRHVQQPLKAMKDFWGILSDDTAIKLHNHIARS
ncbi:hypothetical protein [Niabella soli]|uniref:Uncharacterized protein n=1 Tax=Niabella soli DSM 19437 TaxID=929713 RepID=W0EZV2_9BACT|nr:hypothetical protein [Niabella soli]AHF16277.1 hypothetical protein NIASO_16210 [Niabella soli DSM 19437]